MPEEIDLDDEDEAALDRAWDKRVRRKQQQAEEADKATESTKKEQPKPKE